MERLATSAAIAWLTVVLPAQAAAERDGLDWWGQWRGPLATGVAPAADPPTRWSETENVRWKVPLPGHGHSSPIVWGDRVFVTAAVPVGDPVDPVPDDAPGAHDNAPLTRRQEFVALAFRRSDGDLLWHTRLHEELPHAGAHVTGTLASASPVTDGEHLFAFFGSCGLYCLDFDGELIWQVDLGDMQVKHGHGEGSSPLLHGKVLVVNWDHEGDSFVVALDKSSGTELWRVARDEPTSWASPIAVEHDGAVQVVIAGSHRVRAYDLEDGHVVWQCGGLSHNIVATPVATAGLVIVGSSYEKRAMFAIELDGAKGDITGSDNVVWSRRRRTPYVPSPLLYGEWLYFLNHYQGVLSRVRASTGEEPDGPYRLADLFDIYASPVAAAGRIYVTDRSGVTVVLAAAPGGLRMVAHNQLDDRFSASAALVGGEIYLRGEQFLYCIAETP